VAFLTVAGLAVTAGTVTVPRRGAWHARVRLDAATPPTGAVALSWEGAAAPWRATVTARAGVLVSGGPVELLLVGGAGGLGKSLPGGSYRQATVRLVLGQLLAAAGEQLAGATLPSLLDRLLARWSRAAGPAGAQLASLAAALGVTWRVLPDGGVWLGTDAGAPLVLPDDATLVHRRPASGRVEVATAQPWALASGGTFEGAPILAIEHQIAPTSLRSTLCL